MASGVRRIKLGSQGMEVSALGLGCMSMTNSGYGPGKPEEDMINLIHHAVNSGVTHLDTSDFYGPQTNEIFIGMALKGLERGRVQLATKFGIKSLEGDCDIRGDPEYVRACCEASLKRLDVDYIDLYYVHRVDSRVPIEITMGELKKLVEEGKIKYIGLSEASPSTIRRAHAVHPITAVQLEWSLWTRVHEEEVIPTCRELGIGIVPYGPLGSGFLASGPKLVEGLSDDDFRKHIPKLQGENLEHNRILFNRIQEIAQKKKCTTSQLGLAWVLHQGDDLSPIPGTSKMGNLNQNIRALSVKLSPHDMAELESIASVDAFKGCRLPPTILALSNAMKGGIREKVELATKFGAKIEGEKFVIRGDPAYVRAACEASLKRLDVDCIDLYYQHRIDTGVPIEITMSELKKLVEEGKIKYVGLSEASASTIRRAHAVHPITAIQLEWSLWSRDVEEDIIPTCRELGIGIVAYSPLGRGFFASGSNVVEKLEDGDYRKYMPRFQPENLEHNKKLYERVNEIASKKGCTTSQLALAWVHHQGNDVVPIPGTTKIKNLEQNIGALSVKLTSEEMAELESIVSADSVKGGRYDDNDVYKNWKKMKSKSSRVKLDSQSLEVSAQGLGSMSMSAFYGPPKPEPGMINLIHHAINNGVTFLDTSDVYGPKTNEILLG
ncbi:hypothetical protein M8C21_025635, partial [Ambrosia artemisiifolia]